MKVIAVLLIAIMATAGVAAIYFTPQQYEDCVLENLSDTQSASAVETVKEMCRRQVMKERGDLYEVSETSLSDTTFDDLPTD